MARGITCSICGAKCACRNAGSGICCSDHKHKQRIAYEAAKAAAGQQVAIVSDERAEIQADLDAWAVPGTLRKAG